MEGEGAGVRDGVEMGGCCICGDGGTEEVWLDAGDSSEADCLVMSRPVCSST